jgi:hypothetical protein
MAISAEQCNKVINAACVNIKHISPCFALHSNSIYLNDKDFNLIFTLPQDPLIQIKHPNRSWLTVHKVIISKHQGSNLIWLSWYEHERVSSCHDHLLFENVDIRAFKCEPINISTHWLTHDIY